MLQRILIADDSAVARVVVRRCAEIAGMDGEFVEAEDGQSALLKSAGVDLVLMDLNMPKMHGRDVLIALRRAGNMVPIVIISSAVNETVTADLLSHGATAVLCKPFSPMALCDVVDKLEAA